MQNPFSVDRDADLGEVLRRILDLYRANDVAVVHGTGDLQPGAGDVLGQFLIDGTELVVTAAEGGHRDPLFRQLPDHERFGCDGSQISMSMSESRYSGSWKMAPQGSPVYVRPCFWNASMNFAHTVCSSV